MRYLIVDDAKAEAFELLTAAIDMTDAQLTPAELRTLLKIDAKLEPVSVVKPATPGAPLEFGRPPKPGRHELALEDAEHALLLRVVLGVQWRTVKRRGIVTLIDWLEQAPTTRAPVVETPALDN